MTKKAKLLERVRNSPKDAKFMEKDKKYYMSLNYPIQIEKVEEGFCAFIPMLKGCKAFGIGWEQDGLGDNKLRERGGCYG